MTELPYFVKMIAFHIVNRERIRAIQELRESYTNYKIPGNHMMISMGLKEAHEIVRSVSDEYWKATFDDLEKIEKKLWEKIVAWTDEAEKKSKIVRVVLEMSTEYYEKNFKNYFEYNDNVKIIE